MNKHRTVILNLTMALLLLIALGSGTALVMKEMAKNHNCIELESLADAVKEETVDLSEDLRALRQQRLVGYAELQKQNPDMAGWLSVPDTKIDYPVMQSVNRPDFYLNHDFKKEKSHYGVPYIAEHCDLQGTSSNIVIYGHHMKDGSMFTDLMKYEQQSFYEAHPFIYFDTMKDTGIYRVIGVLEVPAIEKEESFYKKMETENRFDYSGYIAEVKRRAHYETGEIAVYGEPLLTLITCEYTVKEGRFIIVAKKVPSDS
ncbi:MAG: class B sortase [Clostridium sp.]